MAFSQVKFTQLPSGIAFSGSEISCFVQSGVSVQEPVSAIFDYVSGTYIYGPGINFDSGTDTLSVDADLQLIYDNGLSGLITLVGSKPGGYLSTVAGFLLPSMTSAEFQAISVPDNGLMGWSNDSDRVIVNKGTSGSPVYDEVAYLSDITAVTNNSVYGEMNFSGNTTQTVISSTVTPVKIAGTYLSGNLQGFGQASGTLTRSTVDTDNVFNLNISLTASPVSSACNLSFIAMVNGSSGTTANLLQSVDFDSTIPSQQSISISGSVTMANGDTLQIFVRNNTAVQNVLVSNFNCFVTSIGGVNEGSTTTLQQAYTAGDGTITTIIAKPLELISTTSGFRLQSMTDAQFDSIASPLNGLMAWSNDANRIRVNSGSPSSTNYEEVAYLSDVNPALFGTLQDAYDNGDGSITEITGKPFTIDSVSLPVVPTIAMAQTLYTPLSYPMSYITSSGLNSASTPVIYGRYEVDTSTTTAGNESSLVRFFGRSSGAEKEFFKYNGSTNLVNNFVGWDFGNQSITNCNNINSVTINNSGLTHSNTITVGPNNQGVNSTVATVTVPNSTYPMSVGTYPMWTTIVGTPQITPNSFALGDVIELDVLGELQFSGPFGTTIIQQSIFNITVGGIINLDSSGVNFNAVSLPTNASFPFQFKFRIIRSPGTGSNGLNVCGSGFFTNPNTGAMQVINFPSGTWTTLYTSGSTYAIGLNLKNGISTTTGSIRFLGWGITIKQYS